MASRTQAPTGAQPGSYVDPYRSYNFRLEIDGVTEAYFHECSGIGIKVKTVRWRSGGNSQIVHCLPGRVEYSDITLRYGLTNSSDMWHWLQSAVEGRVVRKNAAIVLLDNDGTKEVARWNAMNAWITTWNGPTLNALSNEVAIEEMVLVCESLQRDVSA
jgi:phage tail-like protein